MTRLWYNHYYLVHIFSSSFISVAILIWSHCYLNAILLTNLYIKLIIIIAIKSVSGCWPHSKFNEILGLDNQVLCSLKLLLNDMLYSYGDISHLLIIQVT